MYISKTSWHNTPCVALWVWPHSFKTFMRIRCASSPRAFLGQFQQAVMHVRMFCACLFPGHHQQQFQRPGGGQVGFERKGRRHRFSMPCCKPATSHKVLKLPFVPHQGVLVVTFLLVVLLGPSKSRSKPHPSTKVQISLPSCIFWCVCVNGGKCSARQCVPTSEFQYSNLVFVAVAFGS